MFIGSSLSCSSSWLLFVTGNMDLKTCSFDLSDGYGVPHCDDVRELAKVGKRQQLNVRKTIVKIRLEHV